MDRNAAAWHTWKPQPQQVAQMMPSELPQMHQGAGRWVRPPAVRKVDTDLQYNGQASPRFVRSSADAILAASGDFGRKANGLPAELRDAAGAESTFGTSLALPSMLESGVLGVTAAVPSHAADPHPLPSPLRQSTHRRGRGGFAEIAPNELLPRSVAPAPPGGAHHSLEEWMASQNVPVPRLANGKQYATPRREPSTVAAPHHATPRLQSSNSSAMHATPRRKPSNS